MYTSGSNKATHYKETDMLTPNQAVNTQKMLIKSMVNIALELHGVKLSEKVDIHGCKVSDNIVDAIAVAYMNTYDSELMAINIINIVDYDEDDFDEYSLYAENDLYEDCKNSPIFTVDGRKHLSLSNDFYKVLQEVRELNNDL